MVLRLVFFNVIIWTRFHRSMLYFAIFFKTICFEKMRRINVQDGQCIYASVPILFNAKIVLK